MGIESVYVADIINISNSPIPIDISYSEYSRIFTGYGRVYVRPYETLTVESDRINIGQLRNIAKLKLIYFSEYDYHAVFSSSSSSMSSDSSQSSDSNQ